MTQQTHSPWRDLVLVWFLFLRFFITGCCVEGAEVKAPAIPDFSAIYKTSNVIWTTGGDAPWQAGTVGRGLQDYFYDLSGYPIMTFSGAVQDSQESWVEALVQGPCYVGFEYSWEGAETPTPPSTIADSFTLLLGGQVLRSYASLSNWKDDRIFVPDGPQKLRWLFQRGVDPAYQGRRWAILKSVRAAPLSPISLGEVLPPASEFLTWTTGGVEPWVGTTSNERPQPMLVRSGNVKQGGDSWLDFAFASPGALDFRWKVEPMSEGASFTAALNGGVLEVLPGSSEGSEWKTTSLRISSAPSNLRLAFRRTDPTGLSAPGGGAVSSVRFVPELPIGKAVMARPVDAAGSSIVWTTGGAQSWLGSTLGAAPRPLQPTQESWVEASVEGPGLLQFNYQAPGLTDPATLSLLLNGAAVDPLLRSSGKHVATVQLDPGPQRLRWLYAREGPEPTPRSEVSLSEVLFEPGLPVARGLPVSAQVAWTTGGDAPLFGSTSGVYAAGLTADQSAWMEARVKGPGNLLFQWIVAGTGRLTLDGELKWSAGRGSSILQEWIWVPDGEHRLKWLFTGEGTMKHPLNPTIIRLHELGFVPEPTYAQALDTPGREWISGGSPPWRTQSEAPSTGLPALAYAPASANQSWIETRVRGPATVDFRARVGGALEVQVDGGFLKPFTSGWAFEWRTFRIQEPGEHSVRWTYTDVYNGVGWAFIDAVRIHAPPVVADGAKEVLADLGQPLRLSAVDSSNPLQEGTQWFKDGNALPGVTNQLLTIETVRLSDVGVYSFETRVGTNVLTSQPVAVRLRGAPRVFVNDSEAVSGRLERTLSPIVRFSEETEVFFTLDQSAPTRASSRYTKPVTLQTGMVFRYAYADVPGGELTPGTLEVYAVWFLRMSVNRLEKGPNGRLFGFSIDPNPGSQFLVERQDGGRSWAVVGRIGGETGWSWRDPEPVETAAEARFYRLRSEP